MWGDRYVIRTTEGVEFEFELAGCASRFIAWAVDILLLYSLMALMMLTVTKLEVLGGGLPRTILPVGFFLLNWGYFVLMEWRFGGQSFGKRFMGLRVLSDEGVRITLYQSAVRNVLRVLDCLPVSYLVGGSVAWFHGEGKRLGDIAAGTIVIKERKGVMPDVIVPASERYEGFFNDEEWVERVLREVSMVERDFLIRLAMRRGSLGLKQRLRLFREVSEYMEARLGMEKPDNFSAEKFCLNITALLLIGRG